MKFEGSSNTYRVNAINEQNVYLKIFKKYQQKRCVPTTQMEYTKNGKVIDLKMSHRCSYMDIS